MRLQRGYHIIILLCLLLFSSNCNKEEDPSAPEYQVALDNLIAAEMSRKQIPSLVTCIVQEGSIAWQQVYGYSNVENRQFTDSTSVYYLASISKLFVAAAVMQLSEQDVLDLNADINSYLPFEVRNPNAPDVPITCNMLLTHTSGLAWPTNEEDPQFNNPLSEEAKVDLSTWIESYIIPGKSLYQASTWKDETPGERYQYTNIGPALLGLIVEQLSGERFDAYCRKNIFEPLEMYQSSYALEDIDEDKLVTLYHDQQTISHYQVSHYPSSLVKSSMDELANFLIAIMNEGQFKSQRILSKASVNKMLSIALPDEDLGLLWQTLQPEWIGHTGGYWGATSCMDFHREEKVGVILLSNEYGKETLYPGGYIYELIHDKAEKFFN